MSGVYKVQVPENYRPLGVKKKGRFYFSWKTRQNPEKIFGDSYGRRSPPPFGSPSVVAWKNQKIFRRKPSLRVTNINVTSRRQRRLRANSIPMKERHLVLLNGHLVTIDEYREWIADQQRQLLARTLCWLSEINQHLFFLNVSLKKDKRYGKFSCSSLTSSRNSG